MIRDAGEFPNDWTLCDVAIVLSVEPNDLIISRCTDPRQSVERALYLEAANGIGAREPIPAEEEDD